jgi:hypothetical protein
MSGPLGACDVWSTLSASSDTLYSDRGQRFRAYLVLFTWPSVRVIRWMMQPRLV